MGQDTFHFRTFSMIQAPSGQRVNTDSCAFGDIISQNQRPRNIIDIGTGTGVLALMLASRFPEAEITAVEPEGSIAEVAQANFKASPWSDRLRVLQKRAQELAPSNDGLFDFVICNPPYFQNSLTSDNRLRMVARHNTDLSPEELYDAMIRVMAPQASAWLSFPSDNLELWMKCGQMAGLGLSHHIDVADHPDAIPHMTIAGWTMNPPTLVKQDTIYYRERHKGPPSAWMRAFRGEWYPEKYNIKFNSDTPG